MKPRRHAACRNASLWSALACLLCASALAAPASRGAARNPAAATEAKTPPDDPKLPRVLLVGDSISIGYTPEVRALLAGRANVHRIPENGATVSNGLARIDRWLGTNHWDVIHFNFGLHDLKIMSSGRRQVPVAEYEAALDAFVTRLQKTGAMMIWASTTPVPEGRLNPPRQPGEETAYNAAAQRVMAKHGIAINDLHALALPRLRDWQLNANVHFTPQGYEALAGQTARSIEAALLKRRAVH